MRNLSRRDAARTLAATAALAVAGVPAEAKIADPIFSLIEKANEVRAVYDKEYARCEALKAKIPTEIQDWPGVLCGTWSHLGRERPEFRL